MSLGLDHVVAHLAATPLFGNLPRSALLAIAPIMQQADYPPGSVIAQVGRVDSSLWIVIDGLVSFQSPDAEGRMVHRQMSGYGTVIGARGVFADEPRSTTATAHDKVKLLYLDGAVLWEVLRTEPELLDLLVLPDELRDKLMPSSGSEISPGGERSVGIFRRHPITLVPSLVGLPLGVFAVAGGLSWLIAAAGVLGELATAGMAALTLVATGLAVAYAFYDYWYDSLVVTNRRVMNIERKPFIDERRSAARLDRVQDVKFVQPSVLARLLDYGDITVQTAGARGKLSFRRVRHPRLARDLIFEQAGRARHRAESERQAMIARKVLSVIGRGGEEGSDAEAIARAASVVETAASERPGLLLRAFRYLLPPGRSEAADGNITYRKHWWDLLKHGWLPIGLLLLLSGAFVTGALAGPVASAAAALWLVILVWAWWVFEDWRNDLYVVTRDLVIDIKRRPLGFFSDQRQAPLGQVQDVRFVIPNPLAALLGFGDVVVETAAESGSFTFLCVRDPRAIQEEIFLRLDQRLAQTQRAEQDRRDQELIRWISAYHQLSAAEAVTRDSDASPGLGPP